MTKQETEIAADAPAEAAPTKTRAKRDPKPPMKETQGDLDTKAEVFEVAREKLLGFVERIQAQDAIAQEARDAVKEIYAEVQSQGYSVKALKTCVKELARERDDVIEERATTDLYRGQLGLL